MNKLINNELKYNSDINELRNEIKTWFENLKLKYNNNNHTIDDNKNEDIMLNIDKYKDKKEIYRKEIFKIKNDENIVKNLDLEIVFCNTPDLINQWYYYKIATSSAKTSNKKFRSLKYMIKDKVTNTYLGIVDLGLDVKSMKDRDDYIGWTVTQRDTKIPNFKIDGFNINDNFKDGMQQRLSYLVNINTCVGLQPVAYNLNIGKLLVSSVFSKEVLEEYYKKYNNYYASVVTLSLYGKSIQYDRLKEIKHIGFTKGYGTSHISETIYSKIVDFMKKYHYDDYKYLMNCSASKMRLISKCSQILSLDDNIIYHGLKRGIYVGFTSNQSKDFLQGKINTFDLNNIKSFYQIVNDWKIRWAENRWLYLNMTNRVKIKMELYDMNKNEIKNEIAKQYQFEKMKDDDWVSEKREKNKKYYYDNKNELLEEIKILYDKELINETYIDLSYVAGFFDGDGSIYINKGCLMVRFTQCVLNILLKLQQKYGGSIYKSKRYKENQRIQYDLIIVGEDCLKILNDMSKYSIIKYHRINYGIEYLKYLNKKNDEIKNEIVNNITKSNNYKNDDLLIIKERLNWKYISGLFDAEGCITMHYKALNENKFYPKFSLSQKYTPNLLNEIKSYICNDFMNNNLNINIYDTCLCISRLNIIEKIYKKMEHYLIVKKYQYSLMNDMIYEYNTSKDFNKMKEYAEEIKNNKHKDVLYEIDLDKTNMIYYVKNKIQKNIENKINEIINYETNTKVLQSLKKEGILNPNYGKELSNEHCVHIAISQMESKRDEKLSNDKIREILSFKNKLDDNGKKILQQDVAKKYNLHRDIIRKIWQEKLLPTDDINISEKIIKNKEDKKLNKNISFEEKVSDGKRQLEINEIIEILKYKNKDKMDDGKRLSSPNVAKYFTEKWNKNISEDMVKNYWSGRTKLFESHFMNTNMTYNDYLEIIKKK